VEDNIFSFTKRKAGIQSDVSIKHQVKWIFKVYLETFIYPNTSIDYEKTSPLCLTSVSISHAVCTKSGIF